MVVPSDFWRAYRGPLSSHKLDKRMVEEMPDLDLVRGTE
jgi:hypothetical protein